MLHTERLLIIPCDDTLFEAIRMGNNTLARVMGVNVPKKWTEFRDTLGPSFLRWKANPALRDWWTHLIVYKPDNMLIGVCGYKGEPNEAGEVEIGYEIRITHRQRGLGTEVARALVAHAFSTGLVTTVVAHTLAEDNPSVKILEKIGFEKCKEINDSDEGLIWRWELKRK